jgi:hypothetical protein
MRVIEWTVDFPSPRKADGFCLPRQSPAYPTVPLKTRMFPH